MNKDSFDIYFEFNHSNLNISVFEKFNNKLKYTKQQSYKSYIENSKELNFDQLSKLIEENILEIEKTINYFVNDIYLMIETPESISIKLSVIRNNEGKKINKKDATYLIQDAKQQFLKSNFEYSIVHLIIENYVLDDIEYKYLPSDIDCKKFSIDVRFICFPKNLTRSFESVFSKQQININQIICSSYAKNMNLEADNINICELGKKIVDGVNKQEVVIIPKKLERTGFFERLFHLFN